MRTDRARLIEWLGDMLFDQSGADQYEYEDMIAGYQARAEPWADRIMEDMSLGIIKAPQTEDTSQ